MRGSRSLFVFAVVGVLLLAMFMRVEELELVPTVAIRLNTAPAGQPPAWRMLEKLSKSVRELVEEILEGGREAFEMRRRNYGF